MNNNKLLLFLLTISCLPYFATNAVTTRSQSSTLENRCAEDFLLDAIEKAYANNNTRRLKKLSHLADILLNPSKVKSGHQKCAICLKNNVRLANAVKPNILPCTHHLSIHHSCLVAMLNTGVHPRCPLCREPIEDPENIEGVAIPENQNEQEEQEVILVILQLPPDIQRFPNFRGLPHDARDRLREASRQMQLMFQNLQ